jgi:hypothetical protein
MRIAQLEDRILNHAYELYDEACRDLRVGRNLKTLRLGDLICHTVAPFVGGCDHHSLCHRDFTANFRWPCSPHLSEGHQLSSPALAKSSASEARKVMRVRPQSIVSI